MATGIRNAAALGRISTAMRAVAAAWLGLSTQERVRRIADAVVAELRRINVPVPRLEIKSLPGLSGQFDFGPWALQVDTGMAIGRVNQNPLPVIAALGDTVTHEARHGEQWFRMARLLAGERRGKGMLVDARTLQNRLGIDSLPVCQAAATAPPVLGAEKREAEEWYTSVYGSKSSFRERTFATELRATGSDIGASWQTGQYARYQRALAEEEDAWNTGLELQRVFLTGTGVAPTRLSRHRPIRNGISTY